MRTRAKNNRGRRKVSQCTLIEWINFIWNSIGFLFHQLISRVSGFWIFCALFILSSCAIICFHCHVFVTHLHSTIYLFFFSLCVSSEKMLFLNAFNKLKMALMIGSFCVKDFTRKRMKTTTFIRTSIKCTFNWLEHLTFIHQVTIITQIMIIIIWTFICASIKWANVIGTCMTMPFIIYTKKEKKSHEESKREKTDKKIT